MKITKEDKEDLQLRAKFFSENILGLKFYYDIHYADYKEDENSIAYICGGIFCDGDDCPDNAYIEIREEYKDLPKHILNNAIIHELIHYKLWYLGYPYDDNDKEFIDECHKYGICSNYDKIFDEKKKKYNFDYKLDILETYKQQYQNYKATILF